MDKIIIKLPTPSSRLNSNVQPSKSGRYAYAALKNEYHQLCSINLLKDKRLYASRGLLPLEAIEYDAKLQVRAWYDFDNLVALLKWPIDYLKKDGWITDDDWWHCRPRRLPTQECIPVKRVKKDGTKEIDKPIFITLYLYPRKAWTPPSKKK